MKFQEVKVPYRFYKKIKKRKRKQRFDGWLKLTYSFQMVNVMELMPNLHRSVKLLGREEEEEEEEDHEKRRSIFLSGRKKTFPDGGKGEGGKDQPMQRSVNVSYPLPACPSDRRQFGKMAPLLTPRICIFRYSLSSPNREPPISPSNCESEKRKEKKKQEAMPLCNETIVP